MEYDIPFIESKETREAICVIAMTLEFHGFIQSPEQRGHTLAEIRGHPGQWLMRAERNNFVFELRAFHRKMEEGFIITFTNKGKELIQVIYEEPLDEQETMPILRWHFVYARTLRTSFTFLCLFWFKEEGLRLHQDPSQYIPEQEKSSPLSPFMMGKISKLILQLVGSEHPANND
jgi:hypothetical protein